MAAWVLQPGDRATDEVSYGDQSAWMVSRASGEVVRVNGAAGDVATRVSVGEQGARLELVPVGANVAVLDRSTGEVSLIDSVGLEPAASMTVESPADATLVSNGEDAYLVTRDEVHEITADPLGMAPSIELESPVVGSAVDADGTLWAIERRTGAVRSFSDGSSDDTIDAGVEAATATMAAAGDSTLLVDLATPELSGIGLSAGSPRDCQSDLPSGEPVVGASTTTTADPYVALTAAEAGEVVVWDVAGRRCRSIGVADPGADLGPAVIEGTTGYVPDYSTGDVVVVDLVNGSNLGNIDVGAEDRAFQLFEHNGNVWFNNPSGSASAIIDRNGIVQVIDKLGEGPGDAETGVDVGDGGPVTGGSTNGEGIGVGQADGDDGTGGSGGSGDGDGLGDGSGGGGASAGGTPSASGDPAAPSSTVPGQDDDDPTAELIANFTFSSAAVRVGELVEFVDTSTGTPSSWSWTFGDGTALDGPIVTKAWDTEGTYTVTLTIDREDGATDSASVDISVLAENVPVAPVADFAFTSSVVQVGQAVTFTDRSSGNPTSWDWAFGDQSTASGRSVTHAYSQPGRFVVVLEVSNDQGSSVAQFEIEVVPVVGPPQAEIQASTLSPSVGQFVNFQSRSTNSPTSLRWDFGDGAGASGPSVAHPYASAGTFIVTLTATNSAGSDSTTVTVVVSDDVLPPVARFTVSDTTAQAGQDIVFTSTSLNNPDTLLWNFGDGSTDSGATAIHSFDTAGTYEVTLTATNTAGSSTFTATIIVTPGGVAPVASFEVNPDRPAVGDFVQFTDTSANGPTSWSWDFGDGTTSSGADPSHPYQVSGTYQVSLTVTNSSGSDTATATVVVSPQPPTAAFTASPSQIDVGGSISFADQSTGESLVWSWAFGDGSTSSEQNPSHVYTLAGTYPVTLTVTNEAGSDTTSRTVLVNAIAPAASFTFSPAGGITTADVVTFTDTSTNVPTEWLWQFGDGAQSTAQNPTHQFISPGTYNVTLTAQNSGGASQITSSLTVTQAVVPPVASFNVAPGLTVPAGTSATFTDTSANGPTAWTWTLPDGSTPGGQVANYTFATAGTFTVTLTVSNSAGTDSASQSVTVLPPPPTASFAVSVAGDGVTASFTDTSAGAPTSWSWSFGDGGTSADRNPVHVYAGGTFTVTLTVANAGGSSSASQTVSITPTPPPVASFTFAVNELTASFFDASSGPITSWLWDFGDGGSSAGQSPVYTYGADGTYTVRLTVSGPGGSSSTTASVSVAATPPPPPTTENGG
ncbi:MAG: PKD domain-containing protein [Acidimicrobiales bacterium]